MKLKKISLNNIRSYKNQEIEFPTGSTLLSGDIGCGKTSILLGIEFALFGLQPGQKGSSILRNGAESGKVIIEIEVDGKEIAIERFLKRGKTISQDKCFISINGEKKETSVMELKSFILNLLNYPKEFSKKQNLLYKFTVYTPQEEMKQIILQDPETRVNTLRHIFGIDKYKKIFENISLLASKIREEKRIKQGIISNLDDEKIILEKKENELEEKQYNLTSIEKELFVKTEERKKAQEERELIKGKVEEKNKISQEIEKAKIMLNNKKETLYNNEKSKAQIQLQISEINKIKFDESELKSIEDSLILKRKDKEEINEGVLSASLNIKSLEEKNVENESIKSKISHLENCPTCMQFVDEEYKKNISQKANAEIESNIEKINEIKNKKELLLENYRKLNSEVSLLEDKLKELNLKKIKTENLEEKEKYLKELEELDLALLSEISEFDKKIMELNKSFDDLETFDEIFKQRDEKYESLIKEEKLAEIKVAELKKEIQLFSIQIDEVKERIKKSEEIKNQIDYLIKIENWLSGDFFKMVSLIEKNIMVKLKSEFSKIFSRWFSMLVSESFNVYVRDDFTPVIEQQDYELDYSYLSGGERTAIALAYRLALNQLINSVLSNIKTRDLVILDEPTDGFSELQLVKMRDVLEQLNVAQLIIVSHEQKIESFVENIIKLKKEKGESFIN